MSDVVSTISSVSATLTSGISAATKAKMQALGISSVGVTTEAEAQSLIAAKKAKSSNSTEKFEVSKPDSSTSQDESIKTEAKSLAAQVGATISSDDDVSTILSKISSAISNMKSQAGNDPQKLQQIAQYQAQYDSISSTYTSMQVQQQSAAAQISSSLDSLAMYNKTSLNL